jgi:hypothetical protein
VGKKNKMVGKKNIFWAVGRKNKSVGKKNKTVGKKIPTHFNMPSSPPSLYVSLPPSLGLFILKCSNIP